MPYAERRAGGDPEDAADERRERHHRMQREPEERGAADHADGRAMKRRVIAEPDVHTDYQRAWTSRI